MKRILGATLTLILALALCTAAIAETYTHPVAGYGFIVPEGWIAVDGKNAIDVINAGKENADFSETVLAMLDQLESNPLVLLYETESINPDFTSNINVNVQDLGAEVTVADLLPILATFDEYYVSMFPEYANSFPPTVVVLGEWETAILAGQYVLNDMALSLRQVFFVSGTDLYTVTLTVLTGEVDKYEVVLGGLVTTFIAP